MEGGAFASVPPPVPAPVPAPVPSLAAREEARPQRLDPACPPPAHRGSFDPTTQRLRVQTTFYLASLDCASCVAMLPDGNLIIADTGAHRCVLVSPETGKILSVFGRAGRAVDGGTAREGAAGGGGAARGRATALRGPRGLAVSGDALFVADCYNCATDT